jgi:DsbC/DsbD-like thiol-disulfide interchange protein
MTLTRSLRPSSFALFLVFAGLVGFCAARAQDQAPAPIHWAAALKSAHALQPGQKVTLTLTADIDSGWHIYAFPQPPGSSVIPTEITIPDGQPLSLAGDIQPPQPQSQVDPTIGKEIDIYASSVTFDLPMKVAKKAHAGKQDLEVDARYQACNNRLCLPPRTEKVQLSVEISPHS